MVQLSYLYMTTGKTGKTIALPIWTFVSEVLSLLFNKLSRFVMGFPGPQLVKDSLVMQETPVRFPGQEDPLEKG